MHVMPIGITDDHEELRRTVRRFLEQYSDPAVVRAAADAPHELPPFWASMGELGWAGLHLDEAHGGSGYGLVELGVVLEEFGRACVPGPFLATVAAAAVLARSSSDHAPTLRALAEGAPCALAPNGLGVDVLGARDDVPTLVLDDEGCALVPAGALAWVQGEIGRAHV